MPRYFSVDEANLVVELIRPLLSEILQIRQEILEHRPDIWPVMEKAAGNGGSKAAALIEQRFESLDKLVRQVQATGAILKDANVGLVDFLSLRGGREVYLCWKLGEAEILYWHDVDAGLDGRHAL